MCFTGEALKPSLRRSPTLDAMVLTTGGEACRRADGIAVVPLALLGP
jgi:hypothetical protein